ncbi:CBS domain-containing protein [Chromatiaceae bacterium AAb-1]|nr:CBS domain-containing protein [Chromatiaceae bacterium AAb-1]
MTITAIMAHKVLTTTADENLSKLRHLFIESGHQHIPVTDSSNRLIGIVSVKDYFKALGPLEDSASDMTAGLFIQSRKVRHIMTTPVITITGDISLKAAASLLVKHDIGCLPVVNSHQHLLGLVSWKDIMRAALIRVTQE